MQARCVAADGGTGVAVVVALVVWRWLWCGLGACNQTPLLSLRVPAQMRSVVYGGAAVASNRGR